MVRFGVVSIVAVMALLGGSISAAYAGGMGIGATVAFQCYLISDPSPGQVVEISDAISDTTRTVAVGPARLLCSPVVGLITGAGAPRNPAWTAANSPEDHLKCYDLRSSKGDNPNNVVDLRNKFSDETVAVGSAMFLCVGTHVLSVR